MELELSESRVSGSRYHTVEPLYLFHSERHYWKLMEDWCTETFGPTPFDGVWIPNARWYVNNRKFWFRSKADLSWFMLRWS
jgi:hypothetical protein